VEFWRTCKGDRSRAVSRPATQEQNRHTGPQQAESDKGSVGGTRLHPKFEIPDKPVPERIIHASESVPLRRESHFMATTGHHHTQTRAPFAEALSSAFACAWWCEGDFANSSAFCKPFAVSEDLTN
jgi:hypothetical protein